MSTEVKVLLMGMLIVFGGTLIVNWIIWGILG
jgi:hypothetical protein